MSARRYQVYEVLGKGGFGTVYRGEVQGTGGFRKTVALKVLNPELQGSEEVARRLRDEARMLAMVRHRAVVGVHDLARLDGRWTMVMEYIEGVDLRGFIRKGPLPLGPALEICAEVAGALHASWTCVNPEGRRLYLVHRDLKPSNVRVTAAGEVKVLDFGIARADFAQRESRTRSALLGTPEYMAPERLEGQDHANSDVYSLGIVLAECLTQKRVGRSSSHPDRHRANVDTLLDAVQQHQPDQPRLLGLLGDLLAYDPELRPDPHSLQRLCLDLHQEVGGQRLADWAEALVPQLRKTAAPAMEGMSGTLYEDQTQIEAGLVEPATDAQASPSLPSVKLGLPTPKLAVRPLPGPRRPPRMINAAPGPRPAFVLGMSAAGLGLIFLILFGLQRSRSMFEAGEPPLAAQLPAELPEQLTSSKATLPESEPKPAEQTSAQRSPPPATTRSTAQAPRVATQTQEEPPPTAPSEQAPDPSSAAALGSPRPPVTSQPVSSAPEPDLSPSEAMAQVESAAPGVQILLRRADEEITIPGKVPAGVWSVYYRDAQGQAQSGNLTLMVPEQGTVRVQCSKDFGRCAKR